jgi:signal transduction histidine kinase
VDVRDRISPPSSTIANASRPRRRRITTRTAVVAFVAADLAGVLVISLAVAWVVGRNATSAAVRDARDLTVAEGRAAVWPLLTDGVVSGDPQALARLDSNVRARVLSERIVRVKVWSADGRVLYSDEPRLIGRQYPLGDDEVVALTTTHPDANVSDLSEAENVYERPFKKLLQVYDGLRTASGQPVLFEAYIRFSSVTADGHRTMVSILPAMLAGLLLLFLAQIPLAWTMARRLEVSQAEEQRLLRRSLTAAEVERRHIAADLHDGSVQALAGTALSLTAAAEEARKAGLHDLAERVGDAADDLRQGIRDLRALIVAIAPPRLHDEGLAAALQDLVSPLRARGIEATLNVDEHLDISREIEALAYRSAQEAVRNIVRHAAGAHRVTVSVTQNDGWLRVGVSDDGPGFTPQTAEARRAGGHVGLHLLGELADDAGGRLDVASAPGAGTQVTFEVLAR